MCSASPVSFNEELKEDVVLHYRFKPDSGIL